jgi:hypothetical protein
MKKQIDFTALLTNEQYINSLKKEVDNINNLRAKRSKRIKYKRDWYDRAVEIAEVNFDFFANNIAPIINKTSNLPLETRRTIIFVCFMAMERILTNNK